MLEQQRHCLEKQGIHHRRHGYALAARLFQRAPNHAQSLSPNHDPSKPLQPQNMLYYNIPMDAPYLSGPVRASSDPMVLDTVSRPDTSMAIWQRTLPLCLQTWIDNLAPDRLPQGRILVGCQRIKAGLAPLFPPPAAGEQRMQRWLIDDIAALATRFAGLHGLDSVDIRLETIEDDACWKWHRDYVITRLLTTYRGPATQWIQPADAPSALRQQAGFTGPIEQMERGAVVLMKGSAGPTEQGVVHRSPPVAGSGVTRLLLAINAPSDASPEPTG